MIGIFSHSFHTATRQTPPRDPRPGAPGPERAK
jgi:hypothetical protein